MPQRAAAVPRPRAAQPPAKADPQINDQQRLQQAQALADAGETEQALEVMAQITHDGPVAPRAQTLAARIYANRGDLDQAGAAALRALELDPLNDEAYLLIGIVHARQHEWQLAVQQLERARYLRPDSPLISFHLASAYAELGQTEQAQREYRSTIWKLREHPVDMLLDGVAVGWLRDTCVQQIERFRRRGHGR
jgi:chemotaxis protein methyltransferase CheR